MSDDPLRSVKDTMAQLGVSRSTLYKLFRDGEIAWVQVGGRRRVKQSEIDRVRDGER